MSVNMTKLEWHETEVCVDCAMLIANGEVCDSDGEDVTAAHGELIESRWAGYDLVLRDDDDSWFSWAPCDGCGSRLGGDRYPAVHCANNR